MPRSPVSKPVRKVNTSISLPQAPKLVEMDFGSVRRSYADEDKSLNEFLIRHNLLNKEYGYTAFPPKLLDKVLATGQYRFEKDGSPKNEVFCCRLGNIPTRDGECIADRSDQKTVLQYCEDVTGSREHAMIAVYDLSQMNAIWDVEFKFNPKAFLGVVKLNGF